MYDYEMHRPDYSGTTESDWDAPRMEDFETDDLSEIDDHFLLSSSGFPPETFGDLSLPVVEPGGDLDLNALETAHGVGAIDGIDQDAADSVRDTIEELAESAFDHEIDG